MNQGVLDLIKVLLVQPDSLFSSIKDFKAIAAAEFVSEVSDQKLVSRTTELPQIIQPWDCQAIDEEFVSLKVEDIEGADNCKEEELQWADMTNCTGDDDELQAVIEGYLNDEHDELFEN